MRFQAKFIQRASYQRIIDCFTRLTATSAAGNRVKKTLYVSYTETLLEREREELALFVEDAAGGHGTLLFQ